MATTAAAARPVQSQSRSTPRPSTSTPLASRPSSTSHRILSPSVATAITQSPIVESSSPNYFGFQSTDASFNTDPSHQLQANRSPPSSTVRSAAAYSPSVVPVDQNPDFAAFRRQSEGSTRAFSLGALHGSYKDGSPVGPDHGSSKGNPQRVKSSGVDASTFAMPPPPRPLDTSSSLSPDPHTLRSPKRHLSHDSSVNVPRRASSATFTSPPNDVPEPRSRTSSTNARFSTLSMIKHRAETLPASNNEDPYLVTPQHIVTLLESASEDVLLLDIRVSTHYALSRISGALSLCIPTTLLKRASFNVQKLAETFKQGDQRRKFENWRNSRYIVVYDSSASLTKDAAICLTTIRKFELEGYTGTAHVIKGGFVNFQKRFPAYIDSGVEESSETSPRPMKVRGLDLPPVIGGCPLPLSKSAANPFFGNIRQNMDLIGGVGQIAVKHPESLSDTQRNRLPSWLNSASKDQDRGSTIADRFLHIEKREQKRMQDALSGNVSYGTPSGEAAQAIVQIAGLEKGSKNRYNNIWPFEHTRVKLQGVSSDACDYFNANHISSPLTNKQYIATQGPIPATFNDFWNIVWQQDVRVLVMLTAEKEGGQIKAHNYWAEGQYGPFTIAHLSEHRASLEPAKIHRHRDRVTSNKQSKTPATPDFVQQDSHESAQSDQPSVLIRKLTLSHESRPFERLREITQIQYSSWPDFGAPAHPSQLLGLVEQCDMIVRSTGSDKYGEPQSSLIRPVLVHCSAGCGRTGTFCTVDSVIDMLKRQRVARSAKLQPQQPLPMDIDSRISASKSDDSPFFTAAPSTPDMSTGATTTKPGSRVDGPWLGREDQDLIEMTVENFRLQRLSMVQSLRQYVLCYETILEWLAL